MNKVTDRAKMRREYLWEKKKAWDAAGLFGYVTFLALLSAISLSIVLFRFLTFLAHRHTENLNDTVTHIFTVVGMILALVISAVGRLVGVVVCRYYFRWAADIPYVPSVEEQLTTAPAKEVLLRGSQASPASPEELLRPGGSQETPVEELLRPTSGGKTE